MITSSTAKLITPVRRVLSVLLVVLLVICPLMEIRAVAANIEDILLILWAAIRSCGINLAGTTQSVISFLYSEISELAENANTTITDVIYGLRYSVNSLGQFILNNKFVDFVDDFIDHLQTKYGLTNNQSKYLVQPGISIGDIISYSLPIRVERDTGSYTEWEVYLTPYDVYGVFCYTSAQNHSSFNMAFWSDGHSYVQKIRGNSDGVSSTTNLELLETANNGIYWYHDNSTNFAIDTYHASGYHMYDWDDVHTAFTELSDDDVIIESSSIQSITTIINAPSGDIAFTAGDGAVINIGSNWGANIYDLYDQIRRLIGDLSNQISIYYRSMQDIESQVPESSDVQNLPSGTIYNINGIYPDNEGNGGIRFGGIWHYVADWVEDFTEAAPIIWYVVTNTPSQIVNILYASVVLTVVIGFIHKARSH